MKRKPISQAEAEAEFEYVRRMFFPGWDHKRLWSVKVETDLNGWAGECCQKSKTIRLLCNVRPFSLRHVLIHEIAHAAVTTTLFGAHSFGWQKRMETAARKAERLGLNGLSTEIRQDVERYNDPQEQENLCREHWYSEIRKAVKLQPGASFGEIFSTLDLRSVMTVEEFLEEYKEAPRVYEESRSLTLLASRPTE